MWADEVRCVTSGSFSLSFDEMLRDSRNMEALLMLTRLGLGHLGPAPSVDQSSRRLRICRKTMVIIVMC